MNEELRGRRVDSVDAIEQPGDYFFNPAGDGALWFWQPNIDTDEWPLRARIRIPGGPDGWTFRECDDGSIEVRPSIDIGGHPIGRIEEGRYRPGWHGYLDECHVWRTC